MGEACDQKIVHHGGTEARRKAKSRLESTEGTEITEGLLNRIEVAIRAYDPCLSCATHAMGQMPLTVEILDCDGRLVDRKDRGDPGDGR